MVTWERLNEPNILQRLRARLGAIVQPSQGLFYYTGVLPTIDVGVIAGAPVKTVNLIAANTALLNGNNPYAITQVPQGKRWQLLALSAFLTGVGTGVTITNLGVSLAAGGIGVSLSGGLS